MSILKQNPDAQPAGLLGQRRFGRAEAWLAAGAIVFVLFGALAWQSRTSSESPATHTASLVSVRPAQLSTVAIKDIRLGQRVLGLNPRREQVDLADEPEQATWRRIDLLLVKASGKRLDISLLRPQGWLDAIEARVGETVELDLHEMGAAGTADVLAIASCPEIQPGEGSVVTGLFAHEPADNLVNIWLEGQDSPIGCTPEHSFWSESRGQFVGAADLTIGEEVASRTSTVAAVRAVTQRAAERIYNLETHSEHVYEVSPLGVLVHNVCVTGRNYGNYGVPTLTGTTKGGVPRVDPSGFWRGRYGPTSMRRHHLVPQSLAKKDPFIDRMTQLGFTPEARRAWVHRQMSDIPNAMHNRIHAEGYNQVWEDWLVKNPNFTVADLRAQIRSMMKEFDIPRASLGGRQYGR